MSDKNNKANGGVGFFGLLGIVFIILKLTEVIDWKWGVVLLPLYGPISFAVFILLIVLVVKGLTK
ncbi:MULTISPECIES: hypothetical protein [unclassified Paenibacillus]|uniref:hypothetical protein n=1 Tax=unclassified Paenibacillus TaxID=185978 RepID=UPI0030FA3A3D